MTTVKIGLVYIVQVSIRYTLRTASDQSVVVEMYVKYILVSRKSYIRIGRKELFKVAHF